MESLGTYLKKVRKEKGVSLEQIASRTKINPFYLKALEDDNLAGVPNQVFARGFLRSYLRTLSIDEKEVLNRYDGFISECFQTSKKNASASPQPDPAPVKQGSRVSLFGLVGALVALVSLSYFLASQESGNSIQSQTISQEARVPHPLPVSQEYQMLMTPIETAPSETEPKIRVQNIDIPFVEERKENKPLNQAINPLSAPPVIQAVEKPLSLLIEALEQSWVLVFMDGTATKEMTLQPGEQYTVRAERQFLVTLGNAGGIRMELNGKPLGPYGESGQVVRDILIQKGEEDLISFLEKKNQLSNPFKMKVPA